MFNSNNMICNIIVYATFMLYFRYCLTNAPNVETEDHINVQFISDDRFIRTGAQCTITCIEDSPPPPPQECMFGYDSVCLSSKSTETRTAFCPAQVELAFECAVKNFYFRI